MALFGLALFCAASAVACAPTPTRIPPAPTVLPAPPDFVGAAPEIALPALVAAERQAASERNLPRLTVLWAPDSRITDSRNTPDAGDDYVWEGHAALMDRYQTAVFPNPPPQPLATSPRLEIMLNGDEATAQNGQDRWQFIWRNGSWWLRELVIEPAR